MTSSYADRINGLSSSVAIKAPARVATTANIALTGLQIIDGVQLLEDDPVLVKNQTNAVDNGVWLAATGAWTRRPDMNGARDVVQGTEIVVVEGTVNAFTRWMIDTPDPVIGQTDLDYILSTISAAQPIIAEVAAYAAAAAADAAIAEAAAQSVIDKDASIFADAGVWATDVAYDPSDFFDYDDELYITQTSHTSTNIAADLSAGRIRKIVAKGIAGTGTGDSLNADNLAGLTNKPLAYFIIGGKAVGKLNLVPFQFLDPSSIIDDTDTLFANPSSIALPTGKAVTDYYEELSVPAGAIDAYTWSTNVTSVTFQDLAGWDELVAHLDLAFTGPLRVEVSSDNGATWKTSGYSCFQQDNAVTTASTNGIVLSRNAANTLVGQLHISGFAVARKTAVTLFARATLANYSDVRADTADSVIYNAIRFIGATITAGRIDLMGVRRVPLVLPITAVTPPVLAALTADDVISSAYTAGTYATTVGTIVSQVATYLVNGVSQPGSYVASAGDFVTVTVLVTNSLGNTRIFSTASQIAADNSDPVGPGLISPPTVAPGFPVREDEVQTKTPGTYAGAVTITQSWQTNGIERGTATTYTPPVTTYRGQELVLIETATEAGNPTPTVTSVSLGLIYGVPTSAAVSLEFNVTADPGADIPDLTPTASAIVISEGAADHTQVESPTLMTWNAGDFLVVNLHGRKTTTNAIAALVDSVTVGSAGRAYGTGTAFDEEGLTNQAGVFKPVFGIYTLYMAAAGSGYLQIDWNMNGGAAAMEATHAHYWAVPNVDLVTAVLEYLTNEETNGTSSANALTGDPAEVGEMIIGGVHAGAGGIGFGVAGDGGTISAQGYTGPSGSLDISAAYLFRLALAADVTANAHSLSVTYTPTAASFGCALRIKPE